MRRFGLMLVCLFISLFRGTADKKPEKISTIIVVLTGKLGDIVCGTPVLLAIRAHAPDARIVMAGSIKLQRAVLSDSGLVDEYLDIESKGALSRIKKIQADAAVVTGLSFSALTLFYMAGIRMIVGPRVVGGFSPSETRPYKGIQKLIATFPYQMGAYAPGERLKSLAPLGISSTDTKKRLGFSEVAETNVSEFFLEHSIDVSRDFVVAVSPSAGNKIKEWPEEKFAEVIRHLVKSHQARVIILGGPGDVEKVERTKKYVQEEEVVCVTHFTIDELKAFVSKLSLFVSVDTGPIYIAEAFGVPTVDITGPIDEREQPPIGPRNRVVTPPGPRKPELFVLNAKTYNYTEAMRQINSIEASLVIETVDALINDLRKPQ